MYGTSQSHPLTAAGAGGRHYLLFYEVGEDYVARRAQFRNAHLEKAWQSSNRGELLLGGALADPVDSAVLLFQGDSPAVAEDFARADPYVTNGLVKRWYVREWTTVAGESASMPVKPTSAERRRAIWRIWRARTTAANAPRYADHVTGKVFPALRAIEGHRGACLLRRTGAESVELAVVTSWESMDAVRAFAGEDAQKAVVEPEAQAVLSEFDETVEHLEVEHCTGRFPF